MKRSKISFRGLLKFGVLALLMFAAVSCTSQADKAALNEALKAADYAAVNNLMSLHSWYHAAMRNDLEVQDLWVSPDGEFADTAIWAQQMGYLKGIDHIMEVYGGAESGKYMPSPEGGFVWHTITSGVVEIAEDRQTAKGIWYTPGIVGEYDEDGTNSSQWMWEKYATEFVRENGEWKIWHMKVYTDFSVTVGDAIGIAGPGGGGSPGGAPEGMRASGEQGAPPEGMGAPDEQGAPEGMGTPPEGMGAPGGDGGAPGGGASSEWDYVYKNGYSGWSKDSVVQFKPRAPEPYTTWSETWSYMDEGE